jgi:hypothetical protein
MVPPTRRIIVSIRIDQATPPIIKLRTRLAIAQALKSAKVFAQVEGDCRARLVTHVRQAGNRIEVRRVGFDGWVEPISVWQV